MKAYDSFTDAELASAAQRGDALAESALVRRYAALAEGLSRSYFLAGGDSDDLRQIALIALLEAVRSYSADRGAEFKTYASACVRNRISDAIRSASAVKNSALNNSLRLDDERAKEGGVAVEDIVSPELSPEQQYIMKEAEEAFFDALGETLGEKDLAVIKLYLACMPYKEISKKLGMTAKQVDNTLYYAKKKIEKLLSDVKEP